MIRLRNPDVSEVHRIVEKYNLAAQGISGPYVGAYSRSFGQRHFAAEDLVNSLLERFDSRQKPTETRPEAMSKDEQRVNSSSLPSALDGADGGKTQPALRHELLTRETLPVS